MACRTAWSSSGGAPSRSQRKYSTFPDGPGRGLATTPRAPRPSRSAAAATDDTAAARMAGSRTTPPAPTSLLPTSNCGLTSSTKSASGAAQDRSAGMARVSDMNDRSAVTRPGGGATCSGSRWRTFTRSSTVTRWSVRSAQASCPHPTSTATTCEAPARSSTSVKPPADAPASRQRRPATARPSNAARAPASLCPPREAYRGPAAGSSTAIGASGATRVAGLAAAWPATRTSPAPISSAACSRDRASPRRTSSASSRDLLAIAASGLLAGSKLAEHLAQPLVYLLEDSGVLAQRPVSQAVQGRERAVDQRLAGARRRTGRLALPCVLWQYLLHRRYPPRHDAPRRNATGRGWPPGILPARGGRPWRRARSRGPGRSVTAGRPENDRESEVRCEPPRSAALRWRA